MTTTTSHVSLKQASDDHAEIHHLKAPADASALAHKQLVEAPDWRRIPAYQEVTEEQFFDHTWQAKKSITRPDK
ncbi:MAG TPA: KamA family radical SAM protein, partial [Polyangiaceae bacterium]|nr:KamA family radical SAM protein [Polyangiaceae bacterium]